MIYHGHNCQPISAFLCKHHTQVYPALISTPQTFIYTSALEPHPYNPASNKKNYRRILKPGIWHDPNPLPCPLPVPSYQDLLFLAKTGPYDSTDDKVSPGHTRARKGTTNLQGKEVPRGRMDFSEEWEGEVGRVSGRRSMASQKAWGL